MTSKNGRGPVLRKRRPRGGRLQGGLAGPVPSTVTPVIATAALYDGERLVVVDDLEVPEPGADEVTVRVLASGICHSDLDVVAGLTPFPAPVVLGHEGAGVIEAVGPGVEQWEVGAAVALHGLTPCGACPACRRGHPTACATAFGRGLPRFRHQGRDVRAFANVASFSERTTVSTRQLLDAEGLSPRSSCLVGCAVSTGVGVVRNVGEVGPEDRVAVIGIGGIGANAIQAGGRPGPPSPPSTGPPTAGAWPSASGPTPSSAPRRRPPSAPRSTW